MIYFTSDMHFFHDNIINLSRRPFQTGAEMNETLIKNWNAKISHQDEVYILGDLTMKGPEFAHQILSRLKGKKHLIRGNHDRFLDHRDFDGSHFIWIKDYAEIKYNGFRFALFHYPIAEWNGFYKKAIHLHGHQHNREMYNYHNLEQGLLRYDVGVDANYMSPVSSEEILAFFSLEPQR